MCIRSRRFLVAWRKTIGQFVIYLPLIGLLALAIYSL
nr:MAG TPA: Dolichol-phosphate mannosyltransferase subunit [Caudoviricetes sp.]